MQSLLGKNDFWAQVSHSVLCLPTQSSDKWAKKFVIVRNMHPYRYGETVCSLAVDPKAYLVDTVWMGLGPCESEKWIHSVVSDSLQPHGL